MRLLLVEDDTALAAGLAKDLAAAGYAVDLADNGIDGEFMGREEPYDAVVLDLGLPGKPGLEVLTAWRTAGILARTDKRASLILLYSFIVVYSGIHLLSWASVRYRLPVDAVLVIFAALGLCDLWRRFSRWRPQALRNGGPVEAAAVAGQLSTG